MLSRGGAGRGCLGLPHATAFLDDNARVIPGPKHSANEERFVLLSRRISLRMLVILPLLSAWRRSRPNYFGAQGRLG